MSSSQGDEDRSKLDSQVLLRIVMASLGWCTSSGVSLVVCA